MAGSRREGFGMMDCRRPHVGGAQNRISYHYCRVGAGRRVRRLSGNQSEGLVSRLARTVM
jgi:hypothetical protein